MTSPSARGVRGEGVLARVHRRPGAHAAVEVDRWKFRPVENTVNDLEHIVGLRRREERIAQGICDVIVAVMFVIGYLVYSSVS